MWLTGKYIAGWSFLISERGDVYDLDRTLWRLRTGRNRNMKETYRVKCPERVVFGDPLYFKQFEGERLKKLVVDLAVPSNFSARVTLREKLIEGYHDLIGRAMTIYLAPEETMNVYLQGLRYESQEVYDKFLGVDSAEYMLRVDDRKESIHTGGDGIWGRYMDYTRTLGRKEYLDAVIISISFPEEMEMNEIRHLLGYFFEDLEQVENVDIPNLPEPEIEENQQENDYGYGEIL